MMLIDILLGIAVIGLAFRAGMLFERKHPRDKR